MGARPPLVWLLQRNDVVGGTKQIIDELTARLGCAGVMARAVYLHDLDEHVQARSNSRVAAIAALRDARRLALLLGQERPTLIVTFTPMLGALVALALRWNPRVKVVSTQHTSSYNVGRMSRWFDRLAARVGGYHGIVSCAASVAASYALNGARYMNLVSVIANGVARSEAPRTAAADGTRRLRRSQGIPDGWSVALAAGRMAKEKNLPMLLDALSSAPGWCVAFAGEGAVGPQLEAKARALGLAERVYFLGRISHQQVGEWLSECTAFVQPSVYEGLSLSLLEAMARGVPTLVSDIPANREPLLTPAGAVGWLLPADDPAAWAEALNAIRAHPADAEATGARAREHQRREYDEERMYGQYVELVVKGLGR